MNVAILGFGVVGSGVAEVISKNADAILENSGTELKLRRILDIRDFENNPFSSLMTKNLHPVHDSKTMKHFPPDCILPPDEADFFRFPIEY